MRITNYFIHFSLFNKIQASSVSLNYTFFFASLQSIALASLPLRVATFVPLELAILANQNIVSINMVRTIQSEEGAVIGLLHFWTKRSRLQLFKEEDIPSVL